MHVGEKTKPTDPVKRGSKQAREEILHEELEDSFPASDPPQSTQPHGAPGDPHRPSSKSQSKPKASPKE